MKTKIADILSLIFVVVATGVAVYLYPSLPEQIPTHWNARGEVDDYTAKPWGVFLMSLVAAGTWLMMKLIQWFSPKGFRTDAFTDVVNVFQVTLVGFFAVVGVLVLLEAKGVNTHVNNVVLLGVGLLFLVLGNFMGKVRKNFFIGIRTPWTLASDEVWARTHRLGGWMFMLGGIVIIVGGFAGMTPPWMVAVICGIALIPVVYSFVLYQRIEGFTEDPDNGEESSA